MMGKLLIGGLICCAVALIVAGIWIWGNVGVSMNHEYMVVVLILSLVVGLIIGLMVGLVGVFATSFSYGGVRFVEVINNEQE
jgi:Na+/H+ antiporter NhaA